MMTLFIYLSDIQITAVTILVIKWTFIIYVINKTQILTVN